MSVAVVIPVGPGRAENLDQVLGCLDRQKTKPDLTVIVRDGSDAPARLDMEAEHDGLWVTAPKHEPGREQPRNIGVRSVVNLTNSSHTWFLDSDVIVEPDCLEQILFAIHAGPPRRIVACPYDWLPFGVRSPVHDVAEIAAAGGQPDYRWAMIRQSPPDKLYTEDLSAGLACFSGNLVWPTRDFRRVGGFWSELHHGRCEDGELGVRAVSMGIPISFAPDARGWHLAHPVNLELTIERNKRDVPMLDARHPWIQGSDVFMVDRDGKAFDVRCHGCGQQVTTIGWWEHAEQCNPAAAHGFRHEIPVVRTEGGDDEEAAAGGGRAGPGPLAE